MSLGKLLADLRELQDRVDRLEAERSDQEALRKVVALQAERIEALEADQRQRPRSGRGRNG